MTRRAHATYGAHATCHSDYNPRARANCTIAENTALAAQMHRTAIDHETTRRNILHPQLNVNSTYGTILAGPMTGRPQCRAQENISGIVARYLPRLSLPLPLSPSPARLPSTPRKRGLAAPGRGPARFPRDQQYECRCTPVLSHHPQQFRHPSRV